MSLGVFPQDQGVPDALYAQLHCTHIKQRVDTITVAARERELDEKTVQMLMESIEQTGLRQPIGIRIMKDKTRLLVWGYHRFEAWRRLFVNAMQANDDAGKARWHMIPCLEFEDTLSDDMALLLEIQENLDRKDLTPAQRESGMGKRALLIEKLTEKKVDKKAKVDKSTSSTWAAPALTKVAGDKRGSADYKLLERRYAAFKADKSLPGGGHGKAWNKQTKKEYEAFRQWLVDAEKREEEAQKAAEEKAKLDAKAKRAAAVTAAVKAMKDAGDTDLEILEACNAGGLSL